MELFISHHVFCAAAPPDLSGYSRTFLPSLPYHVTSFCDRGTPRRLAKQGKAIEEFRRMGSLQRTDSTYANQVLHYYPEYPKALGISVALTNLPAYGLFCGATEIEKSQPVNIPDAGKRKKKKRTRATDSFTGTFDGNKIHCEI